MQWIEQDAVAEEQYATLASIDSGALWFRNSCGQWLRGGPKSEFAGKPRLILHAAIERLAGVRISQ